MIPTNIILPHINAPIVIHRTQHSNEDMQNLAMLRIIRKEFSDYWHHHNHLIKLKFWKWMHDMRNTKHWTMKAIVIRNSFLTCFNPILTEVTLEKWSSPKWGNTHDMRAQRVEVKITKATHISRWKERYFFETEQNNLIKGYCSFRRVKRTFVLIKSLWISNHANQGSFRTFVGL